MAVALIGGKVFRNEAAGGSGLSFQASSVLIYSCSRVGRDERLISVAVSPDPRSQFRGRNSRPSTLQIMEKSNG